MQKLVYSAATGSTFQLMLETRSVKTVSTAVVELKSILRQ